LCTITAQFGHLLPRTACAPRIKHKTWLQRTMPFNRWFVVRRPIYPTWKT
ncbi:amylo-alpha-1,6-glucosidase family protein, partial [Vibrio parahaemolyticus V-223/04]